MKNKLIFFTFCLATILVIGNGCATSRNNPSTKSNYWDSTPNTPPDTNLVVTAELMAKTFQILEESLSK